MKHKIPFLLKSVVVGLIAASIYLIFSSEVGQFPFANHPKITIETNNTPLTQLSGPISYAQAVQKAAPAVVNIYSEKIVSKKINPIFRDPMFKNFFGDLAPRMQQQKQTSLGSGVIISPGGYILTNYHVIHDASQINVTLADGQSAKASIVGTDQETDLAVLKIDLEQLPSIHLNLSRPLQVGDVVLAIGNPYGVGQTVTLGIISATGRNHLGINTFENFIQTDAAINPGNSGGALINPFGELIGVNTAIFSKSGGSQGIGFAIPVDLAYDVFTQIIQHGRAVRGWLGVRATTLKPRLAKLLKQPQLRGAVIESVLRDGPADNAGLLPGDIITHINDKETRNTYDILLMVSKTKPGENIKLSGFREGRPFAVTATTAERPLPPR